MIELGILTAGILALIVFSYTAGKNTVKKEVQKETLDAIEKAIEARGSIKSASSARRLLLEYKD